jgi:hypothetical protein
MRSGPPDSLDLLVAKNLAADLILGSKTGLLVAIQGGLYTTQPWRSLEKARRWWTWRSYDRERYRSNIAGVMGLMFFVVEAIRILSKTCLTGTRLAGHQPTMRLIASDPFTYPIAVGSE